jgi:HD-like signal output (HDOD) protein
MQEMIRKTAVPNLRHLLTAAELPALPQSAVRLMQLARNPRNGPPEFAVVIEADPGLAAQVLRFVNSSYFGFSHPISNVRQAIALVGGKVVMNFVLWTAIFKLMPDPMRGLFNLPLLRQDSLMRALFARAFGRMLGLKEVEHVFTAALLQDVAIPFLVHELPFDYLRLIHERGEGEHQLSDLERRLFGWTHADAAALLTRSWGLPRELAQLIESHTRLQAVLAARKPAAAALAVSLSAALPASCDEAWSEAGYFAAAYERFRGNGPAMKELARQLDEDFSELASLLRLRSSGPRLSDRFRRAGCNRSCVEAH